MNKKRDEKRDWMEQGRKIVEQGNARRLILKTADGRQFAEMSLTMAVGVAFVLFLLPMTWLIVIFGLLFAIAAKIRIEIVREVTENDDVLEMEINSDKTDG